MAGKPGMKGGGGARPGAGRPPKQQADEDKVTIATNGNQTPLEFLLAVMNDNEVEDRLRLDAAKTAAQYVHQKMGEGGKGKSKEDASKKAAAGKFGPASPPSNVVKMRG